MSIINGFLSNFLMPLHSDEFFSFLESFFSALPYQVGWLIEFAVFVVLYFGFMHMIK